MANTYQWYSTPYECAADPSKSHGVGWYSGTTFIASTYKNPSTGLAYTPQELQALVGGGGVAAGDTTTPTTPTTPTAPTTYQLETATTEQSAAALAAMSEEEKAKAAARAAAGMSNLQQQAAIPPTIANIEAGIPQLPPYKPTAELEALSTQVGGAISDIITQGGIGMGEETKEQLFLREAEIINASTAQAQRNLEDRMAAQGLSDSGMAFSEGMKLASKSTIAMANVMRDVAIQDSLMKIASYQNALGLGVQFLSYLSEESWRQYQPILAQWGAQVEMYKMAITDAYNKQNLDLAHRYDMELAQFQAQTQKELAQMEIDAAAKAAKKKNWWDIAGTGLGILAGVTL